MPTWSRTRAQARGHPHLLPLPSPPSGPRRSDPRRGLPRDRSRFPESRLAAAGTQGWGTAEDALHDRLPRPRQAGVPDPEEDRV